MFKVLIKNLSNETTHQAIFPSMGEVDAWLEKEVANRSFGKPEHTLIDTPQSPVSEELKASALSTSIVEEMGVEYTAYVIPSEYSVEVVDIASEVGAKQARDQKIVAGQKARQVCTNCLDLIAGYNLELAFTAEQITQMQTQFGPIQSALMTARPSTAKVLINALTPDGVLVTQELKDLVLNELMEY